MTKVRELAESLYEQGRMHIARGEYATAMQHLINSADTFATYNCHRRSLECLSLVLVLFIITMPANSDRHLWLGCKCDSHVRK